MNQKTAIFFVILFDIISIAAIGYAIYDFSSVTEAIIRNELTIPFDTSTYYLLLMSSLLVLSLLQYFSRKKSKLSVFVTIYGNKILIGWFLGTLLLANLIPYYIQSTFDKNGYIACHDPAEISRAGGGESLIYVKSGCESLSDSS